MIIAFCGQAGNGKDTAGEIIIELAKSEGIRLKRIAFADSMKKMVANSFGIYENEIEWINDRKDNGVMVLPFKNGEVIDMRPYLINFGQSVKEHLGGDFWAKLAFSEIAPWPDIVVTDLRFEEEAEYVRSLGGYIIHLYREEDQKDGELAGEQKLPAHLIDFELDNTKDIPYLKSNIQNILNEILYEEEDNYEFDQLRRLEQDWQ